MILFNKFCDKKELIRNNTIKYHTHTHNHFTTLNFLQYNPGQPVPAETFTHSHPSWSLVIPYLLPPSIMIHGIFPVQFTCLTLFFHNLSKFSLVYLLAWHPQFHTPYISSSNHCLLFAAHAHTITFCCSTEIMSYNPSLSVNPLLGTPSCSLMQCIHLTILISAQ